MYNPSLERRYNTSLIISKPSSDVYISYWDPSSREFVNHEDSEMFCYKNQEELDECELYIYDEVLSLSLNVYRLTASDTNDETLTKVTIIESEEGTAYSSIENDMIRLKILERGNQVVKFEHLDLATEETHEFSYSIMYYQSSSKSGVYVF